jgi:hypothetical protein
LILAVFDQNFKEISDFRKRQSFQTEEEQCLCFSVDFFSILKELDLFLRQGAVELVCHGLLLQQADQTCY